MGEIQLFTAKMLRAQKNVGANTNGMKLSTTIKRSKQLLWLRIKLQLHGCPVSTPKGGEKPFRGEPDYFGRHAIVAGYGYFSELYDITIA